MSCPLLHVSEVMAWHIRAISQCCSSSDAAACVKCCGINTVMSSFDTKVHLQTLIDVFGCFGMAQASALEGFLSHPYPSHPLQTYQTAGHNHHHRLRSMYFVKVCILSSILGYVYAELGPLMDVQRSTGNTTWTAVRFKKVCWLYSLSPEGWSSRQRPGWCPYGYFCHEKSFWISSGASYHDLRKTTRRISAFMSDCTEAKTTISWWKLMSSWSRKCGDRPQGVVPLIWTSVLPISGSRLQVTQIFKSDQDTSMSLQKSCSYSSYP